MLNFNSYKPTYVPQPIDQIGKMLETLDNNNQRISQGYDQLATTLSSLNVKPEDMGIVQNTQASLASGMDELIQSGNYDTIQGGLRRLTQKELLGNPLLKAAVTRSTEYDANRDMVAKMFQTGKITAKQYNHFYNQQYQPTVPDQNGVVDPNYKGFRMPTAPVDLDALMKGIAATVGVDGGNSKPEYEYFTKGELASLYGDEAVTNANEPSDFVKYSSVNSYQTKSRDKIKRALLAGLTTNDEARAYINEMAMIDGRDENELINELITPYLEASSTIARTDIDDSGIKFKQDLALADIRGRQALERASLVNRASQKMESGEWIGMETIPVVMEGIAKQYDPNKAGYNANTPGGFFSRVNSPKDLTFDAKDPDNNYKDLIVNERAQTMYNGREFNQLNKTERNNVYNALNEEHSKAAEKALLGISQVYIAGSEEKGKMRKVLFGSDMNELDSSKGQIINGSIALSGMYSIADGRMISKNEVNDYIKDEFGDKIPVDYIGEVSDNNSMLAVALGDYGYKNAHIVNINGKPFAVPNNVSNIAPTREDYNQRLEMLVSDIGEGKSRTFKVIKVPFGQNVSDSNIAINYENRNGRKLYGITTHGGYDGAQLEDLGNNNYQIQHKDQTIKIAAPTREKAIMQTIANIYQSANK
jgi:hypothetical protein